MAKDLFYDCVKFIERVIQRQPNQFGDLRTG